ncbi:MAG: flagellar hook assembly protein FlgD [Hoeflea sp.]|uniref:flagellar hook assembly protein FlgD n=1 Tax=Hoeflea sp. TaxID=1940281 RepID=UPI001E1ACAEB|nr:flagellar hook assembly protein FlgD [Hoeflea sp.]MBU4528956.1 flagellar hook assembly protein FlgD [Alphaproteobacteria bacterium]MBU4544089.1 flagellar hook assembly protein FlgD [Alphaproteobacteria bacterium]MBU4551958.1 flagellar hook assembly protein FlgD [Alphaproteobacteria bacterium]MBV1723423.1 flagellar hook assembly protein FlgD [Hoeflea sp.]MBV1760402.1 flagellar hook assembly protein FlgD [Hoeflea sp.]
MVVNGVNTAAAAATSSSAADKATSKMSLDYDTFLTLLVQQMKSQDPTEPMDATAQIAQLATFSQVEQTIITNKNLESLIQSSALNQAGSLIGRTITNADATVSGTIAEVKVYSDGLMAVLENGAQVVVGAGVTIR